MFHVRPHLALCAPAYGGTARAIDGILLGLRAQEPERVNGLVIDMHLTRMAGGSSLLDTNEDVAERVDQVVADPDSRIVFMSAALCDFEGAVIGPIGAADQVKGIARKLTPSGKDRPRLKTRGQPWYDLRLTPAEKLIGRIRAKRKDVFLVGFKTTAGASEDEQFEAGLGLLKDASCNLVLANDVHTGLNMIVTPEQARYHVTKDRFGVLRQLVDMSLLRSNLHFTRSTVVPGEAVPWDDAQVPATLRKVVDHCIRRGAYKPFRGNTVGHFAAKIGDDEFLTSMRKTDFNELAETGMVRVEARGDDEVVAHGFKPSVGGQSQRIIFREHPDADCIVHFHCPLKNIGHDGRRNVLMSVREQRPFECGSHECGQNTSDGLDLYTGYYEGIRAVMLEKHGPNIVFHRSMDPDRVIEFIEECFDLERSTSEAAA